MKRVSLNRRRAGDPDLENDSELFMLDKTEVRLFWQALAWLIILFVIAVVSTSLTAVYQILPLWTNWISGAITVFIAFVPLKKALTKGSKIGLQAQARAVHLKAQAKREKIISVWLPL